MKTIPLSKGLVSLVDDADYKAVNQFKWCATDGRNGKFYVTRFFRVNGKKRQIPLHRFLLPDAEEVNHRDGDGLNNQRHNLQPCSHVENARATRLKKKGASSSFRGVYWNKHAGKWQAQIGVGNRKPKYLGIFENELEAAKAYDVAARELFVDFAAPNFPL